MPNLRYCHLWQNFTPPPNESALRPQAQKLAGNDELSLFTTPTAATDDCLKEYATIWKKEEAGLWDNTLGDDHPGRPRSPPASDQK